MWTFFKILTCYFYNAIHYYFPSYIFFENITYWYLRVETYAAKLVKNSSDCKDGANKTEV